MYLLDTNVVSMLEPGRRRKARDLVGWLERNGGHLYLSVMTIAEMEAGILKLRRKGDAARASALAVLRDAIVRDFGDRILPMDLETALHLARLVEGTHKRTVELPDLIIAATGARHGYAVLSRNVKDMGRLGVPVHDPFANLPPDVTG